MGGRAGEEQVKGRAIREVFALVPWEEGTIPWAPFRQYFMPNGSFMFEGSLGWGAIIICSLSRQWVGSLSENDPELSFPSLPTASGSA